jgi:hypothetical protein
LHSSWYTARRRASSLLSGSVCNTTRDSPSRFYEGKSTAKGKFSSPLKRYWQQGRQLQLQTKHIHTPSSFQTAGGGFNKIFSGWEARQRAPANRRLSPTQSPPSGFRRITEPWWRR